MFRFKPEKCTVHFREIDKFLKFVVSKVPSFYFGWKPPFARKRFMQEPLWKSWCFQCKICSMSFAANIAVVIVAAIMIAIFFILHAFFR